MEPTSARDLRTQLKKTQSDHASLRLFNMLGKRLLVDGWSNDLAQDFLIEACQKLGASDGLIAKQSSGTLTVLASYGKTFPQAARIPITGHLGPLLKNPCRFNIHDKNANLWLKNDETLRSYLMPLANAGQSTGLFAFASIKQTLSAEDQLLCETLSGLIGCLVANIASATQSNPVDMKQLDVLTPREREIFALMPAGYSNAELGNLLGISAGTAKIHVERILAKLGLRDRTQAAVKAVEFGYKSS